MRNRWIITVVFIFTFYSYALGRGFHVTTTGTSTGDGSINNPWNIETVLAQTPPVVIQPGDTIFIHGGTYVGRYTPGLTGEEGNQIVVMPYNGETVILMPTYEINSDIKAIIYHRLYGSHVIYRDLIFTQATASRISEQATPWPTDIDYASAVHTEREDIDVINCIIYNMCGAGIHMWSPAVGSDLYDCIVFQNGWDGSDVGHGHGIYTQNEVGDRYLHGNIFFFQAAKGLNAYAQGGIVKGYNVQNNVSFENGKMSASGEIIAQILVGSGTEGDRYVINNNKTWKPNSSNYGKESILVGYGTNNGTAEVKNNYSIGTYAISAAEWDTLTVTNNTFISRTYVAWYAPDTVSPSTNITWDYNSYYGYNGNVFGNLDNRMSWEDWLAAFPAFDRHSTFAAEGTDPIDDGIIMPTENVTFIDTHTYADWLTVTVYNWEGLDTVYVDMTGYLESGDKYYLYDVENIIGDPVKQGTYNGSAIPVPMDLTETIPAIGMTNEHIEHTDSTFGCYVLRSDALAVPERCSINIDQILIDGYVVSVNFTLSGNCNNVAAYLFNDTGDQIFKLDSVEPGFSFNMNDVCTHCESGTYQIRLESEGAQAGKSFEYTAPRKLEILSYTTSTHDTATIVFYSPETTTVSIDVINDSGDKVISVDYSAVEGENKVYIDMSYLTAGVYTISLNDGTYTATCAVTKEDEKEPPQPLKILSSTEETYDIVRIEFYSPKETEISVEVFDRSGMSVLKDKYNSISGNNTMELNFSSLLAGDYTVTLYDGTTSVSCTVTKMTKEDPINFELLDASPDPTIDLFSVKFNNPVQGIVHVEVLDDSGRKVMEDDFFVVNGLNKIVLNLSSLKAGKYDVNIDNGDSKIRTNVTKQAYYK